MSRFFGGDSQYLVRQKQRHKRILLLILIVSLAISIAIPILSFRYRKLQYLSYPLAAFSFVGYLWMKKTGDKKLHSARSYAKGAKGEKNIGLLLRRLPDDYLVFQDIKLEKDSGNIDFVVVGRKGVYAIEVKSHAGNITYENGQLLRNGKSLETDFLKQTMSEAMNLHGFLLTKLGKDLFVYPVLVFSHWKAQVRFGEKPIEKVYIVQYRWLINLITDLESQSHHALNQDELSQMLEPHLHEA